MASRRGRGPAKPKETVVGTVVQMASEPPLIEVGDEVFVQVKTADGVVERSATVMGVGSDLVYLQTHVNGHLIDALKRACRVYRRFGEAKE